VSRCAANGCRTAQFEPQLAECELDPYALLEWAPPGWLLILPAGPNLCPAFIDAPPGPFRLQELF
jgi:hypothetical protein